MKMKSILASTLVMLMLFACSNEDTSPNPPDGNKAEAAYVSLKVKTEASSRASGEDSGAANESVLNSIYLITFDNSGNVLSVPGTTNYCIALTGSSATTSPDAFRISSATEKILLIANPGTQLKNVIDGMNPTTTFTSLNAAISNVKLSEINTFTMINSGDEGTLTPGQTITDPLYPIDPAKIFKVSDFASATNPEQAAKEEAEKAINRMNIKIERLASKIGLKLKSTLTVKPAGATFDFEKWTLDGINTAFYPYAEKTLLSVAHTGSSYTYNFYTKDPNFTGTVGAGIDYTTVDPATYDPILVTPYTWQDDNEIEYAIENTMAATEQKYGNATRVVIKGQYYPDNTWSGDWFNFAHVDYENLADLQTAYAVAGATNLQAACDKMYTKISTYATANSIALTGTNFATLTQADLDQISNGGEVIKDGINDVIRWYQDGLCYYYYEIRHDDDTNIEMAFGKYGIVRNNWYSLTLGTINGAGTPWYPDINNPGPGDPDPTDPIDEEAGYIGIEIERAPWIIWDREIVI